MIKFTAPEDRIVRINGNSHDTERDHSEDKEKKILKLLSSDPSLAVTQLSEKLGCSRKPVAACLKKLKEKHKIVRVGFSRKGYWRIV